MRTPEEVIRPYSWREMHDTWLVTEPDALKAMQEYADEYLKAFIQQEWGLDRDHAFMDRKFNNFKESLKK